MWSLNSGPLFIHQEGNGPNNLASGIINSKINAVTRLVGTVFCKLHNQKVLHKILLVVKKTLVCLWAYCLRRRYHDYVF